MVINHAFHRVWGILPNKACKHTRKRKIVHLEDVADQYLSASTASGSGREDSRMDYFTEAELKVIRDAAGTGPDAIRDSLIVCLLETTGLRRTGVLNIQTRDVADTSDHTGRWVALFSGCTLTKGRKQHRFMLHATLRRCIEAWLNTPECEGGRPVTPSPFLLPSQKRDQGQMSTTRLSNIFKCVCERAGFAPTDRRCHLHAMRHSCAHFLQKQGNTAKQISLVLGHASSKITEDVYLRDNVERAVQNMKVPEAWTDKPPVVASLDVQHHQDAHKGSKKKKDNEERSRNMFKELMTTMRMQTQSIQTPPVGQD